VKWLLVAQLNTFICSFIIYIAPGASCSCFVDLEDNARVLLSVLKHLPNDANIRVIVKNPNSRKNLSSDTQ
jgi:hypothetical protein